MENISEKISVVLNEEKRAYKANGRICGGLGSFNIGVSQPGWSTGKVPNILQDIGDPHAIKSKNADILLKLWGTLEAKEKEQFKQVLLDSLAKDSIYSDVAYLIFFVLSKSGMTTEALKIAQIKLKGDQNHGFSNMLGMLSQMVSYDFNNFDGKTYVEIEGAMVGESEHCFNLLEKTNAAKLKILEDTLGDVNPEINYDRDKILSLWDQIFKSPEIPSVINEIEQYFKEGEFTESKFATCIGRVRVLLVDVIRKIASDLSARKSDNKIEGKSDEHRVFDYLRAEKFVDDDQWNLIRALYGMCSDSGAHALIAPKEYARLTKNITYEMILMLLTQFNKQSAAIAD